MKKQLAITIMSTMLFGVSGEMIFDATTIQGHADEINQDIAVSIPDDNLRNELQKSLGPDVPLTKNNLLKIESLNLTYSGVTDLSGLEEAKNLKWLDLTGNAISSLEPLGQVHNLSFLSLRFNKTKDIPDLAPLQTTAIKELNLVGNDYGLEPQKMAAISQLTTLETLEMQNNKLTQLSDLSQLTNLRFLGVAGNKLTDVSGVKNMVGLTGLEVNSNQITDFEPISHLTNLERLHVGNNRSSDISSLKTLTKLKKGNFSQMGLSNEQMTVFAGMKDMESLAIDFNDQISDLSSLSQLTNLTTLDFSKDGVTSLAPLAGLTNLQTLGFSNNRVSDISVLKNMPNLSSLTMLRNQIFDLSPLQNLSQLTWVNAKYQSVTLPAMAVNEQKGIDLVPIVVKSRLGNGLPVTLQSDGQLQMVDGGIKLSDINVDKDEAVYMAWAGDANDSLVRFSGTISQPIKPKEADKTPEKLPVNISVFKGDGSNLTSVASNFVQSDALIETQENGKKALLIKVVVPKSYGAESITFLKGEKVSTKLIGESYTLEYRFQVGDEELAGKPFKENMHVKINPDVMKYDHKYDVFFKINGGNTNTDDKESGKDNGTDGNKKPDTDNKQPDGNKKPDQNKQPDGNKDKNDASKNDGSNKKPNTSENKQEVVTYKAHYLKEGTAQKSVMAQYMTNKAEMYYQDGQQYVVISAADSKSAEMIKNLSLNGKNYFKRDGNKFYFNLGKEKLQTKASIELAGFVGVSTFIPGMGEFNENQPFTLRLDGRQVSKHVDKKQPTGKSDTKVKHVESKSKGSNAENGRIVGMKNVSRNNNSQYNYTAQFLKQGTSQSSVMADYMLNVAQVVINGDQATITIFANGANSANMITRLTLAGQATVRSGNGYTVTLPTSMLDSVITGHVDVDVPGIIKESQPFSLRLTPGFSGVTSTSNHVTALGTNGTNTVGTAVPQMLQPVTRQLTDQEKTANDDNSAADKSRTDTKAKSKDDSKLDKGLNLAAENVSQESQPNDAESNHMNNMVLVIGGIISVLLGFIATTLGWIIFKG